MDSAVLKDIKARLWNGDRRVILELANKEDESKEGSGIDRENNSNKEDKNREGSGINRENNSENKDN